VVSASLLVGADARADVAPGPDERDIPSEVVFTGLGDFPAYRFVLAAIPLPSHPELSKQLPPPIPVRDGEPVSTSSVYFQELRAAPADTPDPVTDAWLAASHAPGSGLVSRKALRVRATSTEKMTRVRWQVRQIQGRRVSAEQLSVVAVMPDGSERPVAKVIPLSFAVDSVTAPPGWQLFLMADPSWPREGPPPPVVPYVVGDVLPLTPALRTLIAVEGAPGPEGSLEGKRYVSWDHYLDPWARTEIPPRSPAVARRRHFIIEVVPGRPLDVTIMDLYQDAKGRWFWDEETEHPYAVPIRWWLWTACGGGMGALMLGAWMLRRRRRARGRPVSQPAGKGR
jgi:hypothetical protein